MNSCLLDANALIVKQWNDAYLFALASRHQVRLATLERKLENMDDLKSPVLHLIPWSGAQTWSIRHSSLSNPPLLCSLRG